MSGSAVPRRSDRLRLDRAGVRRRPASAPAGRTTRKVAPPPGVSHDRHGAVQRLHDRRRRSTARGPSRRSRGRETCRPARSAGRSDRGSARGMPSPWSLDRRSSPVPRRGRTPTTSSIGESSAVKRRALPRRFVTTWRIRFSSPRTIGGIAGPYEPAPSGADRSVDSSGTIGAGCPTPLAWAAGTGRGLRRRRDRVAPAMPRPLVAGAPRRRPASVLGSGSGVSRESRRRGPWCRSL